MRHAEIEAPAQRRDRVGAIGVVDVLGALADHRDLVIRRAELVLLHAFSGAFSSV
jgi:hypothetical protein